MGFFFTYINRTACFPSEWNETINIPLYKNTGNRFSTANCTPVALLNTLCKLCAKYLCLKLLSWIQSENILAEDQVGFRGDCSTLDCCLVLYYLAEKYTSLPKGTFLQAFVDFNSAFEQILTERLWQKHQESSMDKRLLVLIQTLYLTESQMFPLEAAF